MNIAIIDADLIGRKRHKFPNLASMKISAYYKELGNNVVLITEYNDDLKNFNKIFLSKVFTDTEVPEWVLNLPNVEIGGTGFYFDKAQKLPYEIEHHMPDYHLYDDWVSNKLKEINPRTKKPKYKPRFFKYYTDYSIGFLTRGCFRKCPFCVNQNYNRVEEHSPLSEFYDSTRKKICLLDDNFLGCPNWKSLLLELQATKKPFQFNQGLDERILTDEKCEILFRSKYDDYFIFAFDNIDDKEIIENKLKMIRKHTNKVVNFYVLCGFDRNNKYDEEFWKQDIIDTFERIRILLSYGCVPYIMRHENHKNSPYKGMYTYLAGWCNQPNMITTKTFREYCTHTDNFATKGKRTSSCWRAMSEFEEKFKDISNKYYDIKFEKCKK